MGDDTKTLIEALRVVSKLRTHIEAISRMALHVTDADRLALSSGIRLATSEWAREYVAKLDET